MRLIIYRILPLLLFSCDSSNLKFESSKWNTDEHSRHQMVNDIIKNKLLLHKSKVEVLQLLGKPTEVGPCDNCIGYSTNNPNQRFSIDHEVLQINMNHQNQVTKVFINAW